MPHRYFTTEISNGTATLRGADAHHLSRVMRGKLGDTVILCDGNAVEYTATITGFGPETVEFSVEPGYPSAAEPSVEVTLFVGYPKQDKLEQVIRHGVELGCTHFVPFFSRYCVAAPKKEEQKNERYNRIAFEAAKQCGRGVLPDVALPLPNFGALCRSLEGYDLVLFCYELGGAPLRQLLADAQPADGQRLKIARELAVPSGRRNLYLLDEPTTGLHVDDIAALARVLHELVEQGHGVVVIEHNLELIEQADWIIDLGPGGGEAGGQLVAEGTPAEVAACPASVTGRFLARRRNGAGRRKETRP